jgi:hypothetical protein
MGSETTTSVTRPGRVTAVVLFMLVALTLAWPAVGAAGASEDGTPSVPAGDTVPLEAPPATTPPEPAPAQTDEPAAEVPAEEIVTPPEEGVPTYAPPEEVVAPPDAGVPVVEAPAEAVAPVPAPAVPTVLDVTPESSSSITGSDHVLTAAVTDAAGNGVSGAAVDFEVFAGPGDDDVGTPGNTPSSPDLGCVTAGGGPGVAATCTVAYAERANDDGTDRVLAWIDLDGDDATVEADAAEGRNLAACLAESDDPAQAPEPDGTDCVIHDWTLRVPAAVNVTTDYAANVPGVSQRLEAVVVDQGGEALAGVDAPTPVRFYFRSGSAHRPSAPTKVLGRPDLVCRTDLTGSCSVEYPGSVRGVDTLCAVIPGGGNHCAEPVDAPQGDNKADVVEVAWVGGLLDIDEQASSSLAGTEHMLTARVVDGAGAPMTGVEVDLEVVEGPGDDDVGDDGDTPESPDLTCVTGTDDSDAGTCRVAYTEAGNQTGVDAILAWVDADRSDATVEAHRARGAPDLGSGGSGCALGSGIRSTGAPDDIDCVTHSWSARVPTFVDVSPETATVSPGDTHRLDVVVLDQEGSPIVAPTEVQFGFLPGSASGSQNLACTTNSRGSCAVTWSGRASGTDTVCGALAGAFAACGESIGAPERADAADVVSVTWTGLGGGQPIDGEPGGADPDDSSLSARRSATAGSEPGARPGTAAEATPSAPERFARELAKHAPFPVALLVLIGIFLWIQNRVDRKDPKLVNAALDAETLRFE